MERCLKVYPSADTLTIEFVPDIYVEVQPINTSEFDEKIDEVIDVLQKINDYCAQNRLKQIVVIDFDKCIKIYKINLVLFARGVTKLAKHFNGLELLSEVQLIHTNSTIKTIYKAFKTLIPSGIYELVNMY